MLAKLNAENLLQAEKTLEQSNSVLMEAAETLEHLHKMQTEEDSMGPLRSGLTLEHAKMIFKSARRTQTAFSVLCKFKLEHDELASLWSAEKDSTRPNFKELSAFARYDEGLLDEAIMMEEDETQDKESKPEKRQDSPKPIINQKIKQKTPEGDTILMFAAYIGCLDLVKDILERDGSIIDDKNNLGYTALMLASLKGHDHIVQELLEQSADPNLKNNQGKTAAALAEERESRPAIFNDKYDQVLELLISEDCEFFTPTFNLLRRAFLCHDKKVIHRINEKNPKLILEEIENSNLMDEDNKVEAEERLLFEELFEKTKDYYDYYSQEDRGEVDAFFRYILGIYQTRIQDGSMCIEKQSRYFEFVNKYLDMKKTADIQDLKEQQDFFEFLEKIKTNSIGLDDPDLEQELCPFRNQFNSRKAFIKAMQKNSSLREMILNYEQGVEDAREILSYNRTLQTLEFRTQCCPLKEELQKFLKLIEGHFIRNITLLCTMDDTLMPQLLANNCLNEIRYVSCSHWDKVNSEALLSNRNLKKLAIGIRLGGMSEFFTALASQKSLESVSVKIASIYYIPTSDFDALIHFIENNRTLKTLNLDFSLAELKEYSDQEEYLQDVSRFFQAVSRNRSLTVLAMKCSNYSTYNEDQYKPCQEVENILTRARDAFVENYSLISFNQAQSAKHMNHSLESGKRESCAVKKVVTEILGLLVRNNLLQPIMEIVTAAASAPEISDFENPQDTRSKLINQTYEIAMKIYQESHHEDVFLHLSKILADRFPKYPEFAYRALTSIPEQLPSKRLEAQIILSCKNGKGIPAEFETMRPLAKNLTLQLQKFSLAENALSLSDAEEVNSEDSFKEQMEYLFEAQKLYKNRPFLEPVPLRRSGEPRSHTTEPDEFLKHRIDQVCNEYLGFTNLEIQNIQPNAQTITTLLKEIRGNAEKLRDIHTKLSFETTKLTLHAKRNADLSVEQLEKESSIDGQKPAKRAKIQEHTLL